MRKNQDFYSYKTPKSMNEETHYLFTKGRITIKAFFLRLLFALAIEGLLLLIYYNYALPKKWAKTKFLEDGMEVIYDTTFKTTFFLFENITFYIIPILLLIFIVIQWVKRIHDTNKSGWLFFIPLYNIILLFTEGSEGNNDYGINPRPQKQVKYFDELEKDKK